MAPPNKRNSNLRRKRTKEIVRILVTGPKRLDIKVDQITSSSAFKVLASIFNKDIEECTHKATARICRLLFIAKSKP
jgi:hypothetical protein